MELRRFLGEAPERRFLAVMSVGFAWYLLGLEISSSSKGYHQLIELLFWLPGTLYLYAQPRALTLWQATLPRLLLGFAAWSALTILWAQGDTRLKEIVYLLLALNAILVLAWLAQEQLWTLIAYVALLGGGLAWYGLFTFYGVHHQDLVERVVGPGALDAIIPACHYMGALCILLFCFRARLRRSLQRWAWVLSLGGYCSYLLMSKSKGPIISLLMALLFLLVAFYRRRALLWVSGVLVAAFGYVCLLPEYALRGGLSYRPEVWHAALETLSQHPWLGIGLNVDYLIKIPELAVPLHHAHNFFLHMAIQLGLVGLLFWGVIQYAVLHQAVRHFREDAGKALWALSIFAFFSLLTDGEGPWVKPNETWFTFWLPVFLALMLGVRREQAVLVK